MRLYKRKRDFGRARALLPILGGLAVVAAFLLGLQNASGAVADEQLRMTEDSIRRAAVSCYAAEGSYPQNVQYLVDHYGVQIDEKKFVVNYSIIGSNTMPYIEVVPRGGRSRLDSDF